MKKTIPLLVENLFAAINSRDLPTIVRALAPSVVWIQPGNSPVSGTHRGPVALVKALGPLLGMQLHLEMKQLWQVQDDFVIVLSHVYLNGESADEIDLMRFNDGKLIEAQHIGDTAMLERGFEAVAQESV